MVEIEVKLDKVRGRVRYVRRVLFCFCFIYILCSYLCVYVSLRALYMGVLFVYIRYRTRVCFSFVLVVVCFICFGCICCMYTCVCFGFFYMYGGGSWRVFFVVFRVGIVVVFLSIWVGV